MGDKGGTWGQGDMSDSDITASVTSKVYRVLLKFKKLAESTIKQMQFIHSRYPQLYEQPKTQKPHLTNI